MTKLFKSKFHFSFLAFFSNAWVLGWLPAMVFIFLLPNLMNKYEIEKKQSYNRNKDKTLTFFEDFDHDGHKEKINVLNYRGKFASCFYWRNNSSLLSQFNFDRKLPVQENLNIPIFCDVNKDGIKEMFVFTQNEDSLFINAVDFSSLTIILKGRFVSKIGMDNSKKDFVLRPIINHDYNHDGIPEIYFLLNGCYSLYPRKIMAYDFANDTLISSINTGSQHFVTPTVLPDGELVFISTTPGTANCPPDFPFAYPDSCAWLFGFNDRLELFFQPKPFLGFGCTVNGPVFYNGEYHYYVLNEGLLERTNYIISTNLNGEIIRKKEIPKVLSGEKFIRVTFKNKLHYLVNCTENNLIKVYDYNPQKMQFEENSLTNRIPNSSIVPFLLDSMLNGCIAHNFKNNQTSLLFDDFKQKISLDTNPYIKSFNLYFQTQNIKNGIIIMVTDREFLYTYLLSKNDFYPFRYAFFVLVYLLNVGFIILTQYLQNRRINQREKLQKEIAALQLQLVNSQLDPHFIFNALNTVSSNILKDERFAAYDLMNSFSRMMRSAMLFSDQDKWKLEEELTFTTDYLNLMKARFKSLFNFTIELDQDIPEAIFLPRLLIQNFAENAIKHAFSKINYSGVLTIRASRTNDAIEITITDNGIGREKALENAANSVTRSGNGLRLNGKQVEIYNELYQTAIQFEIEDLTTNNLPSGTRVRIRIPFKV